MPRSEDFSALVNRAMAASGHSHMRPVIEKELLHYDDKWRISVTTATGQRHLPRQRIKIEIANIQSYSRVPRSLRTNYDFLPDGYGDTLVMAETLDEIMADKLVSLVNTQRYVRHRDIWDLRWLKQNGAKIRHDWIRNKVKDYQISDFESRVEGIRHSLSDIVHGDAFQSEMARFLPIDVQERTLKKTKFCDFLASEIKEMLDDIQKTKDR